MLKPVVGTTAWWEPRSFFRMEPLAARDQAAPVAEAIADALAAAEPAPRTIRFEGIDAASTWPSMIGEAWPGRKLYRTST